jgi:hypothetical protein
MLLPPHNFYLFDFISNKYRFIIKASYASALFINKYNNIKRQYSVSYISPHTYKNIFSRCYSITSTNEIIKNILE